MKNNNHITIDDSIIIASLNNFKLYFETDETYNEFKTNILNYYQQLITEEKIQDMNYTSILVDIQIQAFKFLSNKVKAGDIDLEIKVIEKQLQHLKLVLSNYKNWLKEEKKQYYSLLREESNNIKNIEEMFIKYMFENSIIETINNYSGDNLFSLETMINLKNKMTNINDHFIEFTDKQKKLSLKNE